MLSLKCMKGIQLGPGATWVWLVKMVATTVRGWKQVKAVAPVLYTAVVMIGNHNNNNYGTVSQLRWHCDQIFTYRVCNIMVILWWLIKKLKWKWLVQSPYSLLNNLSSIGSVGVIAQLAVVFVFTIENTKSNFWFIKKHHHLPMDKMLPFCASSTL